jgi:tetratricopeptide (TPR) repeat protein
MGALRVRGSVLAAATFARLACATPQAEIADPSSLNREGTALVAQQPKEPALETLKAALQACEATRDVPACPALANILSNLGSLYYSIGEYRAAEPFLARAIGMSPVCDGVAMCPIGADDATLHGLAAVYWAEGRASESVPIYERALSLRTKRTSPSDISLLPLLTGLALAYRDSGDYARSRQATMTATVIAELHATEQTADAATNFVILGSILESQGKLTEAKVWLDRGLEVREKLFGPDSIAVANALVFLAALYRHQGQLSDAAASYRNAVRIYRREGAQRKSAITLLSLGRVLADQGMAKDAERLYRDALAQVEQQSGQRDPEMAVGLSALANLLTARHRYAAANSLFHRALEIDRANFPSDDPRIASDLSNIGALALKRKQYGEAEELLQQSTEMLARRLPPDHVEIGKVTARLAELRGTQGRIEDAVVLFHKALRILEGAWGPEDPQLLPTLESYSSALRASHDYVTAGRVELQTTRIQVVQTRSGYTEKR